jgi:hypothetical protein
MTTVPAEMAKNTDQSSQGPMTSSENPMEKTALDRCYRQIGISAVAAAVRYQGVGKNPAYAPTPHRWQERTAEAAA